MQELKLTQIKPTPLNTRADFSHQSLESLAASIRQYGILEPILVRPKGEGFEIIVGERRFHAAQLAGLDMIPVIIREYSDDEVMEINLVENVQREDLSAVEKAQLCAELRAKFPEKYRGWGGLARRIGVEAPTVRTWMRTLSLSRQLQEKIAPRETQRVPEGKIDFRTALEIHQRVKDPTRQLEVAARLAQQPLSRTEREEVIRRAAESEPLARAITDNGATMADQSKQQAADIVQEVARETRPTIVFNHRHYRAVLEGTKTQATRRRPDPQIKGGTTVRGAVNHFADLEVRGIERKRLSEFTEADAQAEGGYSLEEFKQYWIRAHGEWNPNDIVYLIKFEVQRVR